MTKKRLREGQRLRLDSPLELSAAFRAMARKTARHEEAVTAFIEKRKPRFDGSEPRPARRNGATSSVG